MLNSTQEPAPELMLHQKQVLKSHYSFQKYVTQTRWSSIWHQLDEVVKLQPRNVLEIGPGPGLFKHTAKLFGINVETLDLDPELSPDHVGSATSLQFPDGAFDVVCAFQMLEHLPYPIAVNAFQEMRRVCNRNVLISLPDSKILWSYQLHLPKLGKIYFSFPRPSFRGPAKHTFDGEHYWELNKLDYPLSRVIDDFSSFATLVKTYRVRHNPYHRFFLFSKSSK